MALLPLFRGELELLAVTLNRADVLLEVGSGDTNNYTFGSREGPPGLPDIDTFSIRDSVVGYKTAEGELYSCTIGETRAQNMAERPVAVEGQIACGDVPIRFSLSGGTPEQFASPTAPWPMALTVSVGSASLVAKGNVSDPGTWDTAEFQVSIEGEKVDSLETLLGAWLPDLGPYRLSATLGKSKETYSISHLKGSIGASDVVGELQWYQAGARPVLKGKITSQSLNIQELFANSEGSSANEAKPDFLDRPIAVDWLSAIDAEIEFDIKSVLGSPLPVADLAGTFKLKSGGLSVSPLQATLAGTPVTGDLSVILGKDAPAIRLTAASKGIDLGKIFEELENCQQPTTWGPRCRDTFLDGVAPVVAA